MNFEVVIGLEIHVEMITRSKMFSSAPVNYGLAPNTQVDIVDMAFPGTLPVVNKQAVINAIRVSQALHMEIDHELHFDRKNYFYSDLPKGYQITQDKRPIGRNGHVEVTAGGARKRIEIERLHMEEDTCKQLHMADHTLLDYNRAGVPLLEIVTYPVLRSGEEAMRYVEAIRSIVIYSGVSDGKMEEGSLRCDVNISLRPFGSERYGTKVEIKNLNSLSNIEKAIDHEIRRQERLLLSGIAVEQETRRFDELKKETVLMRKKTDAVDYKYFTEPNIVPIRLSEQFIQDAIRTCPELASAKKERYLLQYGLNDYDADILLADKDIANYFDSMMGSTGLAKLACNWLMVDVAAYLNKNNMPIKDFKVKPQYLAELIEMIDKGKVSNKQGRQVFERMTETNESPGMIAEALSMTQVSDDAVLLAYIFEVLKDNPQSIEDFKAGRDKALGFLVGQIMKKSQGKANPGLTSRLLVEELKKR